MHGLVDATTCSASTDGAASHPRLRHEILEGSIDVGREFLLEDLGSLLRCEFVDWRAAAFSKAAKIEGQYVEAGGGQAFGEIIPNFALAIALVEQKNARTGLSR